MKRMMSILLIYSICLQGYIYQIQVMHGYDTVQNKDRYVIGLSDFHDKLHPANGKQRSFFLSMLESVAHKDMYHIITEDLSSPNQLGVHESHNYAINSRQGMLAGITQDCKERGFTTDNLEYRFRRVIALGQLLHQPRAHPFQHQPACKIRVGDLLDEVQLMVANLKEKIHGQLLSAFFARSCAKMNRAIKRLDLQKYKSSSCAAFLHCCTTHENRESFLKDILTFDSALLDCAILSEVLCDKRASHMIIIAGGTHIARTFEQLVKMGYKQLQVTSLAFEQQAGLTTLVSTSLIKQGQRPAPIDLAQLRAYLK